MRTLGSIGLVIVVFLSIIALMNRKYKGDEGSQHLTSSKTVEKSASPNETARVPYVGCKSDGQGGPVAALQQESKALPIDAEAGQQLAYYAAIKEFGVLAPRKDGHSAVYIFLAGLIPFWIINQFKGGRDSKISECLHLLPILGNFIPRL